MANPYEGKLNIQPTTPPSPILPSPLLLILPSQISQLTPPVEHNIKPSTKSRGRRPSMSSFFNQLSQIETSPSTPHNNPHAVPTPGDVAATERLLRDQFESLLQGAPTEANAEFLTSLISATENPIDKLEGVPQSYLDELERVPKKQLRKEDACPICAERFLDDEFPLVVVLPCHSTHRFDLECVAPWLRMHGTCPMDRKHLLKKKEVVIVADEEEEEEWDTLYA